MRPFLAAAIRRSAIRSCSISARYASFAAVDKESRPSDRDLEQLGRAVAVALAVGASGLGFWLLPWSSSSLGSWLSLADSDLLQNEQVCRNEAQMEKKPRYLLADSYRRKVFFKYEKRIRILSSPEKIFKYFASSQNLEGELVMKPADLMRAIVPVFPPSESNIVREGYLRGERNPGELYCSPSAFFILFDTDSDGLISFPEYIFFVTLLSIPESSFSVAFKMFDLDNDGEIKKDEFMKVMDLMRAHTRQGASHRNGLGIGLNIGGSIETGGLIEHFFGRDGMGSLQHDKFVQFLRDLHDEEFKAFAELRKRLKPLSVAIFSYGKVNGLLTKQDFIRAASHVCGISLTENVVDVIFHVFDTNCDGNLSSEEFVRALQRRQTDIQYPSNTGIMGLLSCWLHCTRDCSSSQLFSFVVEKIL
ncbi:calcium uptake protein, mitochondrial-like isoform X2 [Curcuma longa]|uniref:calcium uptake protein, mitochondrial-like isoform X2 n=1 Tax=Curcuma longa TaxID=136217 RepID=UPI003D9E0CD9